MRARGWLMATAAGIIAVAAVGAAILALRGGVAGGGFAAGSPEAVVTEFVQAVIDRDVAAAHALLSVSAQARCSEDALARGAAASVRGFGLSTPRWSVVLLERRDLASGRVQLRVRLLRTEAAPPWESVTERSESLFVLEASGDGYRIASFDWPGACH
jgi:hypothetical protein